MTSLFLAASNPQSPDAFADGAVLALFIVVPLIAAGLCTFLPWAKARNLLALLVPAFGLATSGWLLVRFGGDESVIADNVGNFVGGVAIPLVADTLSALMIFTTALVALVLSLIHISEPTRLL